MFDCPSRLMGEGLTGIMLAVVAFCERSSPLPFLVLATFDQRICTSTPKLSLCDRYLYY